MKIISMQIAGAINSQTKTSIKNALDKIEGVQKVDIDKTLGSVEVGFKAPADETGIRSCIEEAGLSLSL